MKNWILGAVLAIGIIGAPSANAFKFSPLRVGAYGAAPSDPYPSFPGVGLTISILDFVRLEGGFGATKTMLSYLLGFESWSVGFGAKVRIPFLKFSPVVGLSWARSRLKIEDSYWVPDVDDFFTFLTPFAGFEYTLDSRIYIGGGLIFPQQRRDGRYRQDKWKIGFLGQETKTEVSFLPSVYVGFHFF